MGSLITGSRRTRQQKATGGFKGSKFFEQKDGTLYGYVADASRVTVGVLETQRPAGHERYQAEKLDNKIYDFLSGYTRYGGNVGGNTVGSRPDYDKLGVT